MPYRLSLDEDLSVSVRRSMAGELDRAIDRLTREYVRDPLAAVHGARKNLKKSRSLLRLTRSGLPAQTYREEMRLLSDCARSLSRSRDADALVATLAALGERYVGQIPAVTFDALQASLAHAHPPAGGLPDEAQVAGGPPAGGPAVEAQAVEAQADPDVIGEAEILRAARVRIETWPTQHLTWDGVVYDLSRSYARGRKRFSGAQKHPTVENLHDWRKRVKDLWYQQRLLQGAWPGPLKAYAKQAHELSELLGDDHDLAVLGLALQREPAIQQSVPADIDAVIGLAAHRREELQAQAFLLGERVYSERTKAFSRRMKRLLAVAR
jgi:hypothetical protein